MRRILFKLVRITLYLLLIIGGVLVFLVTTPIGTRTMMLGCSLLFPTGLSVGDVSGTLQSGLAIRQLRYHDAAADITVNSAMVKIDLASLLEASLHLTELTANQVVIHLTDEQVSSKESKSAASSYFPGWLRFVKASQLMLTNITVSQGDVRYVFKTIKLQSTQKDHYQFLIDSNLLNLNGEADLTKVFDIRWKLSASNIGILIPNASGNLASSGSITGTLASPIVNMQIIGKGLAYDNISINQLNLAITQNPSQSPTVNTILRVDRLMSNDFQVNGIHASMTSSVTESLIKNKIHGSLGQYANFSGEIIFPGLIDFVHTLSIKKAWLTFVSDDLSKLAIKIPQVKNIMGQVQGKVMASGDLRKMQYDLNVQLNNAGMSIPVTGTRLKNINLTAKSTAIDKVSFTGSVRVGGNPASMVGEVLYRDNSFNASILLKGNHLTVVDTHEYKVTVTPDLSLKYTDHTLTLGGDIFIPVANIAPVEFENVLSIPEETTFANEPKVISSSLYRNLILNLNIKLGQRIDFKYDNLKARLSGHLNVRKEVDLQPLATGEIDIADGLYRAYGTQLHINAGKIVYARSPLNNPGINLKATKQIKSYATTVSDQYGQSSTSMYDSNNITVGVHVTGTADKPIVLFFSNPAGFSQRDILSYIVFGYPASQVTSGSGLALLSSLGSRSGETGITDHIQNFLGLSELGTSNAQYYDPQTGATGSASTVNIGKQLGRNLSIHYSVSFLSPISILNIRYQINKHLSLQAETSNIETGTDLVYAIERN